MSTTERQVTAIELRLLSLGAIAAAFGTARTKAQVDAIADGWNGALEAMQFVAEDYDETAPCAKDNHPGWWGCRYCGGEKYSNPGLHTPENCPVAACQAAIALMEESK